MKMYLKLYLILIVLANIGCNDDVKYKSHFDDLTSNFYQFEESNRIDFRSFIQDNHMATSRLSTEIIFLYDLIDTVTNNLLTESGGYNEESAYLNGGADTHLGSDVVNDFHLFDKIINHLTYLKSTYGIGNQLDEALIKEIEICLHPIISNFWTIDSLKGKTVAKLYLDLMIIQNRLLVFEIRYYNLKYPRETKPEV